MKVRLYQTDGVTQLAAVDIPQVDIMPKVAFWNERAFILLSTHHTAHEANYVETVSLRLELADGSVAVRHPRPGLSCACGCGAAVLGRGRFSSRSCWARAMNASWSDERKVARARRGGFARQARIDARTPASPTSRFL